MSVTDLTDYKARIGAPHQRFGFLKNAFFGSGTGWNSLWIGTQWVNGRGAETGAAPGAAAAPTRATTGAIAQRNPASADNLRVWIDRLSTGQGSVGLTSAVMIADRLGHSSGLDATVTGAQSTNLPTAALTRNTTGTGVFAAAEIYTTIGATPTTMAVTYTDDAGNTGQVAPAIDFGGTGKREQQRFLPIPLLQGDTGVRAVASVNIAGSTGTAGNFGITLWRPLLVLPLRCFGHLINSGDPLQMLGGLLPKVVDDSCLWLLVNGGGQVSGGLEGSICFTEA